MPTTDPLQEQVDGLAERADAQREDFDKLEARFDQLAAKFGPGTKFLVDLEERLVYPETTITAVKNTTTVAVIETLPGALHASYRLSAEPTETGVVVITDGLGVVPTNGCAVCLGREYKTGPTRIEITVRVYNSDATNDHPIKVKIWKRLGLG